MKNNKLNEINKIFLISMIFNITISSMAALRQKERKYNIQPTSHIDAFLDKNYPDEYMDKIFANKIER